MSSSEWNIQNTHRVDFTPLRDNWIDPLIRKCSSCKVFFPRRVMKKDKYCPECRREYHRVYNKTYVPAWNRP